MVHLETWNEWHEGTDIARSRAWGDRYLQLTARLADRFRHRERVPPTGPFARAERVRWDGTHVEGLTLLPSRGDGLWDLAEFQGRSAVATRPLAGRDRAYLYFDVDESYLFAARDRAAELTVVYRADGGCERLRIEYDNTDPSAGPRGGAFRPGRWFPMDDRNTFRTVKLILPNVRFTNRANHGDFRIVADGGDARLTIAEVVVRQLAGTSMTDENK
jgi:hypothetical protein